MKLGRALRRCALVKTRWRVYFAVAESVDQAMLVHEAMVVSASTSWMRCALGNAVHFWAVGTALRHSCVSSFGGRSEAPEKHRRAGDGLTSWFPRAVRVLGPWYVRRHSGLSGSQPYCE